MRVDEVIEHFGTNVKLKRLAQDQPNYDELRGEWIGEPVYEEEEITAIVKPLHVTEEQFVAGENIKEVVEIITTADIKEGDRVEVSNRTYKVVEIKRVFFGNKLLYTKAVGEHESNSGV